LKDQFLLLQPAHPPAQLADLGLLSDSHTVALATLDLSVPNPPCAGLRGLRKNRPATTAIASPLSRYGRTDSSRNSGDHFAMHPHRQRAYFSQN
jgi:hypothetical protein